MKKIAMLLAAVFTLTTALVLTSCTKDETNDCEYVYRAGFTKFQSSMDIGMEFVVEQIYLNALGVTGNTFILRGNEAKCDNKVKTACQSAEKEVAQGDWHATFTFQVKKINGDNDDYKVIYSYTYPSK